MVNFKQKRENNEKKKSTHSQRNVLADPPDAGGTENTLSGKHPRPGTRLNGVRRRARKPQDAERVSEESEAYISSTRFIESSLGIKSYKELAPFLEALAFAEGRFLFIHPFYDFNGRVARMLLFSLLYRLELPPVRLVPVDGGKVDYLSALSESDKSNWQPLVEIWRGRFGAVEK